MQRTYVSVLRMVRETRREGPREKRRLMLCKKVLRIVLWQKTRTFFLQKIKTRQYSDWLRPKYYIAIVMDDFFKLHVKSYGQQNSI